MHINVVFVDGKEIKKLNKTFLNHTYETDVIAFEYGIGNKGGEGETFGDVFVCYDGDESSEFCPSGFKSLYGAVQQITINVP